jgi:hypothetical protein
MTERQLPDKETLIRILRFFIEIHPLKPIRPVSMIFIYMGLLEQYPDIVSYRQLTTISRRKKTPEQIAEAVLLLRQHEASDIPMAVWVQYFRQGLCLRFRSGNSLIQPAIVSN